jgi:oligoendopeptidase F
MSMELLAGAYLAAEDGGYYSRKDAARARIEHLESVLSYWWPYIAVVDAFQHWVYTHHEAASDPANCDAKWAELWARFMKGQDWSGLDAELETGWQRKAHIFQVPFYYIDYGLAQVGAMQVWRNSMADKAAAVKHYRHMLSLGGTRSLPDLFAAGGAQFAVDAGMMGELVAMIEGKIQELENV